MALSLLAIFAVPQLDAQGFEVDLDCSTNFSLVAKPYGGFSHTSRTDCAPASATGETEVTFTLNDAFAVQAFVREADSQTKKAAFYVEWTVTGGVFLEHDNGTVIGDILCVGEASPQFATSSDICSNQGLTTRLTTNPPFNNILSSTVRILWDNTPGASDPEVKAKLVFEEKNESLKPKVKFTSDIYIKASDSNGSGKTKIIFCEKKMKLGPDLSEIDEITASYSCSANRYTFNIIEGNVYEGCFNEGRSYGYRTRVNNGNWSGLSFTSTGQFSVGNVGATDRVSVEVTPYFRPQFTGVMVRGTTIANQVTLTGSSSICGNFGFIPSWRVVGLNNVSWSFSSGFPTSSVSFSGVGNILNFTGSIPNGRYAVVVSGRDNLCGDPFTLRRYFTVKTCSTVGGPGGDGPVPLVVYNGTTQYASTGIGEFEEVDGVSIENDDIYLSIEDRGGFSMDQTQSMELEKVGPTVTPTLLSRGQQISVRRTTGVHNGDIQIALYDMSGRHLLTQSLPGSNNEAQIATDQLTPGVYLVRTISVKDKFSKTHRVVIR